MIAVKRLEELDFLKGLFIILMIIFHLEYTQEYPYLSKAVYTFHMPAFLLISGYLSKIDKEIVPFFKGILKIAIPYVIFEVIYVIMLSILGGILNASNSISDLSISAIFQSVFLHPKGLYWYLHTHIICTCVYFFVSKISIDTVSKLVLMTLILYLISCTSCQLNFYNSLYYVAGAGIGNLEKPFTSFFPKHPVVILPLILLFSYESNLDRSTLSGIAITFLMIGLSLYVYRFIPRHVNDLVKFLGRNTIVIVLFSPIFTIGSKLLAPIFNFDRTNIIAIITSTIITLLGCIIFGKISDRLNLSKLIFHRETIIKS